MKDYYGHELKEGDDVLYLHKRWGNDGAVCVDRSKVEGFTPKRVRVRKGLVTANRLIIIKELTND